MDIAYQACVKPFTHDTYPVTRSPLVTHLCNYLVLFRRLCQHTGFKYVMGQGLLYIHMFAPLHGGQCMNGVVMIGAGDRNPANMSAFFVQHFPDLLVLLSYGE